MKHWFQKVKNAKKWNNKWNINSELGTRHQYRDNKNMFSSQKVVGYSIITIYIFFWFTAHLGLGFLKIYLNSIPVRSAAPQTTLCGGPGRESNPGRVI